MPFTANRQFKKAPRLLARAEGMYYWTPEAGQVLDGTSGLWCVNAGHCRPKIVEAVKRQVAEMDFAPTFQMGHPVAFEFAERLAQVAPPDSAASSSPIQAPNRPTRPQDRACLPPGARRSRALPAHRPRARLPRRELRHGGGRHHAQQGVRSRPLASTTSGTPTTWRATPSPGASRSTAPSSPTSWSGSVCCMILDYRRGDRRAGAGRPAYSCRRWATSSACAKSAIATESCSSSTK